MALKSVGAPPSLPDDLTTKKYVDDHSAFYDTDYSTLSAAVTALPSGRRLVVTKQHVITTPIIVDKPLTMEFTNTGSIKTNTVTCDGIHIRSSNVTLETPRIIGTGNHISGVAKAIHVQGFVGAPLRDVTINNPDIRLFNKDAIWLDHTSDFFIYNPQIQDCGYSGVITISCKRGQIVGGYIRSITMPSPYPNVYGIALTRDSTLSISQSPRSEDILVLGVMVEGVPWEGIDTHGGANLRIIGNTVLDCLVGIALVACPNPQGVDTWAPVNITCTNNYIDGRVSNGTKDQGIKVVGAGVSLGSANEYASGIVANNTIVDHGTSQNIQGLWGGIITYFTRGLILESNILIRPGGAGIQLYHTNVGMVIANNVIEDVWSTSAGAVGAVYTRSTHNEATITGTQIIRGSKSATLVNSRGLWINSSANTSIVIDSSNRWDKATLPIVGAVMYSFFGTPPRTKPTSVPVTVAGIHAALVSLGLIS